MPKSISFWEIRSSLENNFEKHKENFLRNVNIPFDSTDNECWEWIGKFNVAGYGLLFMSFTSHRFSYLLYKGELPPNLHHKCVNKRCVNPNHLLPTTIGDNVSQGYKDGRMVKGKFFKALSSTQIEEIENLYAQGFLQSVIAEKFNINQSTVSNIIQKKGKYAKRIH